MTMLRLHLEPRLKGVSIIPLPFFVIMFVITSVFGVVRVTCGIRQVSVLGPPKFIFMFIPRFIT